MSTTSLRVLLIRHGETDENRQRIIQGQLDTDLNSAGRLQAHYLGRYLSKVRIDEVYSSPLKRARDTALSVIKQNEGLLQLPNTASRTFTDARLMERNFGVLQGKPGAGRLHGDPEGSERTEDVCSRLAAFWSDMLDRPGPWPITDDANKDATAEEEVDVRPLDHSKFPDSVPHGYDESQAVSSKADAPVETFNRTVVVVSHGSALSNLMNGVLLREGNVALGNGVQPARFANCSITEIVYPSRREEQNGEFGNLPVKSLSHDKRPSALLHRLRARTARRQGVVVRWSDATHLPKQLEAQLVMNVDESVGKSISKA